MLAGLAQTLQHLLIVKLVFKNRFPEIAPIQCMIKSFRKMDPEFAPYDMATFPSIRFYDSLAESPPLCPFSIHCLVYSSLFLFQEKFNKSSPAPFCDALTNEDAAISCGNEGLMRLVWSAGIALRTPKKRSSCK